VSTKSVNNSRKNSKNCYKKASGEVVFIPPLAVVSVRGSGAAASVLAAVLIRGAVRLVVERVKLSARWTLGAPSRSRYFLR